jgi:DNA-binding beta-propeller fold protein YncE
MPQFARDFQNSNERMLFQRRLPPHWIKGHAARWLLALFAVFSVWLSAFAQSPTPGCLPYSINYPCIYVADYGTMEGGTDSTVTVINASTNSVIGTVGNPIGSGALGIALTPNNAFAYVALNNAIAVIDTSTNEPIKTITLSTQLSPTVTVFRHPSQIAFAHDGAFAWVTEQGLGRNSPASVEAIDTTVTSPNTPPVTHIVTNAQPNLPFNAPTAITLSLDGKTAYVADNCGNYACVDVIDTSTYAVTKQVSLLTIPFDNAAIAITPDGSLVCISVYVNSKPTTYGVAFIRTSDNSVLLKDNSDQPKMATFSPMPDSNYGLGITLDGTLYVATDGGIVLVNTGNQTYTETIQFGIGPTGIAVGPDGVTVYVTNAGDGSSTAPPTVSVIKGGLLIGTINGVGNSPKDVAVMPSLPPTIVTQPSSQTIDSAQSATLSVAATGTPPLTYQWYQGQSGDTSTPIQGATSSSYTTPASLPATTSYWVAVSNLVTQALVKTPLATGAPSTTATIMPTLHAPTCTLSLQGTSSLLTVAATATCTDGQQQTQPLLTTLSWGDGSSTAANNGTLVANKTYSAVQTVTLYIVTVTSTDTAQLSGTTQVDLLLSPATSVFAGQAVNVGIQVLGQAISNDPVKVSFDCTTVVDSNGHVSSPSDLNISCSSNPSVLTLAQAKNTATIIIKTTGAATSLALGSRHANWFYAFLLPIPAFLLAGVSFRSARTGHTGIQRYLAMVAVAVMLPLATSCGGEFTPPMTTQISTPAGSYQITVVDMLVGCQTEPCPNTSGFVQTTLIVPLVVSPTQ